MEGGLFWRISDGRISSVFWSSWSFILLSLSLALFALKNGKPQKPQIEKEENEGRRLKRVSLDGFVQSHYIVHCLSFFFPNDCRISNQIGHPWSLTSNQRCKVPRHLLSTNESNAMNESLSVVVFGFWKTHDSRNRSIHFKSIWWCRWWHSLKEKTNVVWWRDVLLSSIDVILPICTFMYIFFNLSFSFLLFFGVFHVKREFPCRQTCILLADGWDRWWQWWRCWTWRIFL